MNRVLLGLLCFVGGLVIIPLAVFAYLNLGRPPVAVSDISFPMEKPIVRKLLHDRIEREMQNSPIQASPETLVAGAAIYKDQCAFCHGLPATKSNVGHEMFPSAPQLWRSHRPGVVGVSDDPVGETYWRVSNGIRLTGMPSYKHLLSDEQMWQVSLLLASAAKPLPDAATAVLAAR